MIAFALPLAAASGASQLGALLQNTAIGGTAGVLVHLIFPAIPLSLAVVAVLPAAPGSFLDAPLSVILIAVGAVGLGLDAVVPIGITVVTAHLCASVIVSALAGKPAIDLHDK